MTKDELHRIVDRLPDSLVGPAVHILEALAEAADPLLAALESAPVDDEPLNDEDLEASRESREARDRTNSH